MRVIEPGHLYAVHNVDCGDFHNPDEQTIRFVRRRDDDAGVLAEYTPGILSQELLRVLIDRVLYLNAEEPCDEDTRIVHHLRDSLRLFEARAARRTIERLSMPERADACPICHHLLCAHGERKRLTHKSAR